MRKVLLSAIVALIAVGVFSYTKAKKPQPNIIFIIVDTMRADHLGCYGYPRNTSPNIDQLAADGMRFEKAIAQSSWTRWSIGSFLTSQYPDSLDLGPACYNPNRLPAKCTTLAEALKQQGYATSAVISNRNIGAKLDFNQGFDSFDESGTFRNPSAPIVYSRAIKELHKLKGRPFFLMVLNVEPHAPYHYREGFDFGAKGKCELTRDQCKTWDRSRSNIDRMKSLYDSEIASSDYHIGQFVDELKKLGLYENTMIVLLSDHGEEFNEHGSFLHGHALHRELIHVPLIVKKPHQRDSQVVSGTFPLIDLYPSIMATLDFDTSNLGLRGRVLNLNNMASVLPEVRTYSSVEYGGIQQSVQDERYKLILHRKRSKLYDLLQDPDELNDISAKEPGIVRALERSIHDHLAEIPKPTDGAARRTQFTPAEVERLKSLGYL